MNSVIINNCVVLMPYGSRLYGTTTKNSDNDFVCVSMPIFKDLILCNVNHSKIITTGNNDTKNNKDDIDMTIHSLHKFIQMACKGETVAMDMLHAPNNMILNQNSIWRLIIENRTMFYTKHINSYMGYIKKQASKYCLKGTRLSNLESVITFLSKKNRSDRLETCWDELPILDHTKIIKSDKVDMYNVCGLKYQKTIKIGLMFDSILKRYEEYGQRAEESKMNNGIDWKAVSHALRYSFQLLDLYNDGYMSIPLKEDNRKLVLDVKLGNVDYIKVSDLIDFNVSEIERLSLISNFPDTVDLNFWNNFLEDVCVDFYKNNKYEESEYELII